MNSTDSSDLESLRGVDQLSDAENPNVEERSRLRKAPRRHVYSQIQEFANVQLFNQWWDSQQSGLKQDNKYTNATGEDIIYYRCQKDGCGYRLKVIYSATSQQINVEESTVGHDENSHRLTTLLTIEIKAEIKRFFEEGHKPYQIRQRLLNNSNGSPVPSLEQVQNQVKELRKKKSPTVPLRDIDLANYYEENRQVPANENQSYVVGFWPYSDEHFLLVWSTPKLIRLQRQSEFLATDATYRLNWYGFPVFVAGTFDINGSFHPTFCALASHEDVRCFTKFFEAISGGGVYQPVFLLADGAQQITNAGTIVFPNAKRLMCWAHAIKNIDKRLKSLRAAVKKQIRSEIEKLQFAINEDQFRKASKLLVDKWITDYGDDFEFGSYFREVWLDSDHWRWFEGASTSPSTNNGLESLNKQIKQSHSLRERVPFHEFVRWLEPMVANDWSLGRVEPTAVALTIHPHIYVSARQLLTSDRKVFVLEQDRVFAVPSSNMSSSSRSQIKRAASSMYSDNFDSFEEYYSLRFKVHVVVRFDDHFSCTCHQGSKKHPCKHSVFVGCKLGTYVYPPDSYAITLDQKKKRGRPSKAKKQHR